MHAVAVTRDDTSKLFAVDHIRAWFSGVQLMRAALAQFRENFVYMLVLHTGERAMYPYLRV